jgi:hypothetical protein
VKVFLTHILNVVYSKTIVVDSEQKSYTQNSRSYKKWIIAFIGLGVLLVVVVLFSRGPKFMQTASAQTANVGAVPTLAPGMCWSVQNCQGQGGTSTKLEYCGDCTGSGCSPGYTCQGQGYECKTFSSAVFSFDELYPAPCSLLEITPTTVSQACRDQQYTGDYNCDGAVTMADFNNWFKDFSAGRTSLPFLVYWQRAVMKLGP